MKLDFPAPWTVVEAVGEFYVRDATGSDSRPFLLAGCATGHLAQNQARHLAERFATMTA